VPISRADMNLFLPDSERQTLNVFSDM
jgi:hypothetical protein